MTENENEKWAREAPNLELDLRYAMKGKRWGGVWGWLIGSIIDDARRTKRNSMTKQNTSENPKQEQVGRTTQNE